jgi:hypothetical protein
VPAGQQVEVDDHEQVVERSPSPRRRGWCAPGCRTRMWRASGSRRCGRWARPPTRSWSWPSSWPVRASSGSWSSPLRLLAAVRVAAGSPRPGGVAVNAHQVKHLPGRPRPTSWMRCGWPSSTSGACCGLVRPTRPDPPAANYTRLRADLTHERSRHKQRLEKLLEDALIKLSSVATDSFGVSGRAMLEALVAGQRDPERWPGWPEGGCAASTPRWWRR